MVSMCSITSGVSLCRISVDLRVSSSCSVLVAKYDTVKIKQKTLVAYLSLMNLTINEMGSTGI